MLFVSGEFVSKVWFLEESIVKVFTVPTLEIASSSFKMEVFVWGFSFEFIKLFKCQFMAGQKTELKFFLKTIYGKQRDDN